MMNELKKKVMLANFLISITKHRHNVALPSFPYQIITVQVPRPPISQSIHQSFEAMVLGRKMSIPGHRHSPPPLLFVGASLHRFEIMMSMISSTSMLIAVREGPVPSASVFLSHKDLTSSQRCNPVVIGG